MICTKPLKSLRKSDLVLNFPKSSDRGMHCHITVSFPRKTEWKPRANSRSDSVLKANMANLLPSLIQQLFILCCVLFWVELIDSILSQSHTCGSGDPHTARLRLITFRIVLFGAQALYVFLCVYTCMCVLEWCCVTRAGELTTARLQP